MTDFFDTTLKTCHAVLNSSIPFTLCSEFHFYLSKSSLVVLQSIRQLFIIHPMTPRTIARAESRKCETDSVIVLLGFQPVLFCPTDSLTYKLVPDFLHRVVGFHTHSVTISFRCPDPLSILVHRLLKSIVFYILPPNRLIHSVCVIIASDNLNQTLE